MPPDQQPQQPQREPDDSFDLDEILDRLGSNPPDSITFEWPGFRLQIESQDALEALTSGFLNALSALLTEFGPSCPSKEVRSVRSRTLAGLLSNFIDEERLTYCGCILLTSLVYRPLVKEYLEG